MIVTLHTRQQNLTVAALSIASGASGDFGMHFQNTFPACMTPGVCATAARLLHQPHTSASRQAVTTHLIRSSVTRSDQSELTLLLGWSGFRGLVLMGTFGHLSSYGDLNEGCPPSAYPSESPPGPKKGQQLDRNVASGWSMARIIDRRWTHWRAMSPLYL